MPQHRPFQGARISRDTPAQPQPGMSTAPVPPPNSVLAGVPRGSKARSTLTRSFAAFFAALALLGGSWLSLQRETQQEPAPVQTSLIDVGVARLRAAAATAAASPPAASRIILAAARVAASPPPPPEAAATAPPPPPTKAAKQLTETVRAAASVQQPGDVPRKAVVAICAPTRSQTAWRSAAATRVQTTLIPSIERTITAAERERFTIRLHLGISDDDAFWRQHAGALTAPAWLELRPSYHPAQPGRVPFNEMTRKAFDDGAEYVVRINDDTEFVTASWVTAAVGALRAYTPPNVGVVGPTCHEGNVRILTHDMVHRSHLAVFGVYYPRVFKNWRAPSRTTRAPAESLCPLCPAHRRRLAAASCHHATATATRTASPHLEPSTLALRPQVCRRLEHKGVPAGPLDQAAQLDGAPPHRHARHALPNPNPNPCPNPRCATTSARTARATASPTSSRQRRLRPARARARPQSTLPLSALPLLPAAPWPIPAPPRQGVLAAELASGQAKLRAYLAANGGGGGAVARSLAAVADAEAVAPAAGEPAAPSTAECTAMRETHGVVIGQSWGSLPVSLQRRWAQLD